MSIYTVSQITYYLKQLLERDQLLADLYITGEVSNLSKSSAGHHYFTLKDSESQMRCVMFRGSANGSEFLQHGASVTVHGRVSVYQQRGELQLMADLVQPEGVGELHMEFLRLKAKLEAEGLFDPSRKRPLPAFPRRIAVITSRTGAVFHDIQNIIRRRYPLVELVLVHSAVQGEQAPPEIVSALRTVNDEPAIDVVVLARGGGSLEELWAFNDETVARAIHASRVPVVSAVGHETDFTIADFVADVRAPTPSAAAELVVPDRQALKRRIQEFEAAAFGLLKDLVQAARQETRHMVTRLEHLAPDATAWRQRVDELTRAASAVVFRELALSRERVRSRALQLGSLHPRNTLARGYAIVERSADGALVSRVGDVRPGDAIGVQVSDGRLEGQVLGAASLREPQDRPSAPSPSRNGRKSRKKQPAAAPGQISLFS